jgi:rhamnose transport system permease protein
MDSVEAGRGVDGRPQRPGRRARRLNNQWELTLGGILVVEIVLFAVFLPRLLNPGVLLGITINFMEVGLITMPMVLLIISKNIDISVGSTVALVSIVLAASFGAALPSWLALLLALACGAAAGWFNGIITTKMKIPSLVVTLGTYSLYRGIAYVVLGDQTFHDFPDSFLAIGRGTLAAIVPVPLVIFVLCAAVFGVLLHATTFGRKVYAIGNNATATLYSGVKVDRVLIAVFMLVGVMTAVASIVLTSRNASTRGNMALGMELDTITAVVLGGSSIGGGKGTVGGAVIAVFVIGLLRNGMYAMNISPELMKIFIGALLILSLLIPKGIAAVSRKKA